MHFTARSVLAFVLLVAATGTARAQGSGLPTSQPNLLVIYQEDIKVGHRGEHEKTEAGWPAAFERAQSADYYLALASMTGSSSVWFVQPAASYAALGESLKRETADAALAAELERLHRVDAEHLTGVRTLHARARPDLSRGAYPDTASQRFWDVTTFQVRPGHGEAFEAAVKAYGAASQKAGAPPFRVYDVVAGMPGATYLIFSSATSLAEFDKAALAGQATWQAVSEADREQIGKALRDGVLASETQRFQLNGPMSYVSREVIAQDQTFWRPAPKR
jgi:hypothetical protein